MNKKNPIFNFEHQVERISLNLSTFSVDLMAGTKFFAHPVIRQLESLGIGGGGGHWPWAWRPNCRGMPSTHYRGQKTHISNKILRFSVFLSSCFQICLPLQVLFANSPHSATYICSCFFFFLRSDPLLFLSLFFAPFSPPFFSFIFFSGVGTGVARPRRLEAPGPAGPYTNPA